MRAKSKEEKELQGTFEPSKESVDAIEHEQWDGQRMPAAESTWPPSVQAIWNARCKELFKAGYLAKAFLPALRRYCFALMQAEEAEEKLSENGFVILVAGVNGAYEKVSPWLGILDQANKTLERIGAKFGFSPLDAAKIPAIKKDQKTIEENLFD